MKDSVLWVVALASGAFGLLLLSVAGAVAVYWKTPARKPKPNPAVDEPQSRAGDIASAEKASPPADPATMQQGAARGINPWAWIKAWIFAIVHASTVSVVLGGITFFQDLARASEEIQDTGNVTFPRQLLPGTLSMPSRKQLSQPLDEREGGHWEVEGLINEAGVGRKPE